MVPGWLRWLQGFFGLELHWPVSGAAAASVVTLLLVGYGASILTYLVTRRAVLGWDLEAYRKCTGKKPSQTWDSDA